MAAYAKYRLQHSELQRQKERDMTRRRTSFTARRGRMNVLFNPSRWGWKTSLKYTFSGRSFIKQALTTLSQTLIIPAFLPASLITGQMWVSCSTVRGSEGLANNLLSPVGGVDSTSTTGPVFRSDRSEVDPAILKGWKSGGKELCACACDMLNSRKWPWLDFHTIVHYLHGQTKARTRATISAHQDMCISLK